MAAPRRLALAYGCVTLVLLLPLLVVEYPPLGDYSGHLARAHIALRIDQEPALEAVYDVDWRLLPNLASDVILYSLGHLMPVAVAGRVFVGLCVVLTLAGVATLNRVVFGRWSFWPLAAALIAYHGALMAGFISFSLASGLLLFGVALWIGLRERPPALRLAINAAAALLLFLAHGYALGLYGLIVGGFELRRFARRPAEERRLGVALRDGALLVVPFVLPAALFVAHSLRDTLEAEETSVLGPWMLSNRIRGVLMPVLTYDYVLDVATLLALIGVPAALLWFRRLAVAPGLVPGVALILVLFVLLPSEVFGAFFMADRMPVVAGLVALAALQPRGLPRRAALALGAAFAVLLAARVGVVTDRWLKGERFTAQIREVVRSIEPGSGVLLAAPDRDRIWANRFAGFPDWHYLLINMRNLPLQALLPLAERAAFTASQFTRPNAHILSVKGEWRPYDTMGGLHGVRSDALVCEAGGRIALDPRYAGYDYVMVFYLDHLAPEQRARLEALDPVARGDGVMLLDADRLPDADPAEAAAPAQSCDPL